MDTSQFTQFVPKIPEFDLTPELVTRIFYVVIGILALFYVWQMNRHRILIEINEKVKGGVVPRYGRYRQVFDAKKQMFDLRPMRGREILPSYPSNFFQKMKGLPVIGPLRFLCLMRLNKYSYAVITPNDKNDESCNFEEYNTKAWVYKDVEKKYRAKVFQKNLLYFGLHIAPLVVIVLGFVLIGFGIWGQYSIMVYFGEKIEYTIKLLCTVATNGKV
jgi:hypothetical protein